MIATDTLIVIANGQEAKFMANTGTALSPKLVLIAQASLANKAAHELGRDRPGHAMGSQPGQRTSFEQKDLHKAAEEKFLRDVAQQASEFIERGTYKKTVLIAEKHALGLLRTAAKGALAASIAGEIAKDYTKTPALELQEILAAGNKP